MKTLVANVLLCGLQLAAQETPFCPMHPSKPKHQADVEKHGDQAMGFPHDKTNHHFRLTPEGGAIEVTVNDVKDTEKLEAIRMHLRHIVAMFSAGDFSVPVFVHSQTPPGVSEMKDHRADITYAFEELPAGARVRIATRNQDALNAIHDFLNFQIAEHHTGDATVPLSYAPSDRS